MIVKHLLAYCQYDIGVILEFRNFVMYVGLVKCIDANGLIASLLWSLEFLIAFHTFRQR